jgi:hypothetical protein
MAINDLVGLLTGTSMTQQLPPITSNPQVNILNRMRANTQQIGKAGRGVAGGVRGLLGLPPLPPSEEEKAQTLRQNLNALDLTNLDDLESFVGMIAPYDPIRAANIATGIREKRAIEADKVAKRLEKEKEQDIFGTYLDKYFQDQGLGELARSGVLTPANFKDVLSSGDDDALPFQFGGSDKVMDETGQLFYSTQAKNPEDGTSETSFSPIGGSPNSQPVGKLTPLTSSGETAEVQRKGKTEAKLQEEYGKRRMNAVANMPSLIATEENLFRAVDLVDQVPTGGPINLVAYGLSDFFGTTSADKAELEVLLGQEMYKVLKPFFGGVISDTEATRIEAIYPNLKKGSAANQGILKVLIKSARDAVKNGNLMLENSLYTDYDIAVNQLVEESKNRRNKTQTIKFSDLK